MGGWLWYFREYACNLGDLVDTQILHLQVEILGIDIEYHGPVAGRNDSQSVLGRDFVQLRKESSDISYLRSPESVFTVFLVRASIFVDIA